MASILKHLRSSTADKRPTASGLADGQIAINTASGTPAMFFKDSNGGVVKVGPAHVGSAAPNAAPAGSSGNSLGELWVDNSLTTPGLKYYTGSAFVNLTPSGTTTAVGLVELATGAETQTGTDAVRAVTPSGLQSKVSDSTSTTSSTTIASSTAVKAAYDLADAALPKAGGTVTGELLIGNTGSLVFEGSTDDGFETTLAVVDPTADRTITFPNVNGTVVTTGDSGTVTSTMIANDTIVNADINSAAAIADTKLATISAANKVSASALDIDGATDIGGALADADLFVVDDGGAGTNRKAAATRITDYAFGKVSGDITIGSTGTAAISSGVIVNADVNASAAIAGTKISPDFGSQNITTTGTSTAASFIPTSSTVPTNGVYLPAANSVAISTNGTGRLTIDASGNVNIDSNTLYVDATNNRVGLGTSTPGSILTAKGPIASTSDWGNLGITSEFAINSANRIYNGLYFLDSGTSGSAGIGFSYDGTGYKLHIGTASSISSGISTALTVDRSQRVGIGTTSVDERLHVVGNIKGVDGSGQGVQIINTTTPYIQALGTSTINDLQIKAKTIQFETGTTYSTSQRVQIDSSGRLLVGTSSARTNYFNTTAYGPLLNLEGTSNSNRVLSFVHNDSSGAPILVLGATGGSTAGSNTPISNTGTCGILSFQGADGSELVEAARIACDIDGTPGADDMPGRLVFSTTPDGASSPTERMRITNAGKVTIGAIDFGQPERVQIYAPDAANGYCILTNVAGTGTRYHIRFENGNGIVGSITTSGVATAYNTSSDYRLKENIVPLAGAVDRLNQLEVYRFNFITDPDKTVDGFIAHEAQAVVPECVTGTKDEVDENGDPVYQGIDQSKLVPLLTAALQEAIGRIETLEAEVAALKAL